MADNLPEFSVPQPLIEALSPEQLDRFHADGYLIVPNYLDTVTCTSILATINHLLNHIPLSTHPLTKFTTGDSSSHVGDDYFLTSGDKVRYFFEEDAFDSAGALVKPAPLSINKIGHSLHTQIPIFSSISHSGPVGALNSRMAKQLGFRDPRLLQSMVICKQPEIGGAVPPHQDSTFLYTHRPSAVGFWIALEKASQRNGCLSFLKGSHKWAGIEQRFVRNMGEDGKAVGTEFKAVSPEEARWPRGMQHKDRTGSNETYELGEVDAGTLVIIHGNLLHKSEKNLSPEGRMIYTFHIIEGVEEYDEQNWLQLPGGPAAFTKLKVNH